MLWTRRTVGITRLSALKRWSRHDFRLIFVASLTLVAGLHLGATSTPSVPTTIRGQNLEIINEEGMVVFSVRATDAGGRLEVRDGQGAIVFSAGLDPNAPKQVALWEQSRQEIAALARDIERQRQDVRNLALRLQAIERHNQPSSQTTKNEIELDQYRSAIARQDRELANLERQISRLSRQLDSLERRR